jgi:hypothetical protein
VALHTPPTSGQRSNTVTSWPKLLSTLAAATPAKPAPTTAIRIVSSLVSMPDRLRCGVGAAKSAPAGERRRRDHLEGELDNRVDVVHGRDGPRRLSAAGTSAA